MVTAICQTDLYDPYLEAIGSPPEPAELLEAAEPVTCVGGDGEDDDDENKSALS